jgi:primosomal protein N' (replication factor Y) (superfamily II helicase)
MQYIHVRLLNGFPQPLTYSIPDQWEGNFVGAIVKVPLKDKAVSAYVIHQTATLKEKPSFTIKQALGLEQFPTDTLHRTFINQLSAYYQIEPFHFIKRIKHFINQEAESTPEVSAPEHTHLCTVTLTPEQQHIVDTLTPLIGADIFSPALLHGVTGSGKTEVYKQLILKTIEQGKTALLLLPEVSLALRFEQLLKQQLPLSIMIASFHSGTRPKDKRLLWQSLLEKKPLLIIGVHIPILLPIANLGCIIVDEEHETGYQEKKHPKVNTKEAALMRAQLYKIPILLGSATPSITSLATARSKRWHFFTLHHRFAGAFPAIKIVLLTNKERRTHFWITKELHNAIQDRLHKHEQVIIFLNRRGYSFFVQCKECSFIFECTNCSVSLTLHNTNELACHYCGANKQLPATCPTCKKTNTLLKKGIGTQQVVSILEQLFPTARIGRADMDVSSKKKVWQHTMQDFENGTINILVGTQTITKGFHFPNVTLVGILWADLNLHFPTYNAGETSLQQLIQVAGRAGRTRENSTVIVQAMMMHPVFNYLNETDYLKYYEYELHNRKTVGYPPALRLVEIELKNSDEAIIAQEAMMLAHALMKTIAAQKYDIRLLGPAKPPVSKIKNTHARKIYLKSASMSVLIELYRTIKVKQFKSSVFFTPNPSN